MAQIPDLTVKITVDVSPALAAAAMIQLETWRIEQGNDAAVVDVVIDADAALVRLFPGSHLRSFRGEAPTFYEAAQLALADAKTP